MSTNTEAYISSELTTVCSGEIVRESETEARAKRIAADCKSLLQGVGRERVLARLEAMVNSDVIGVEGARKVWRATFGGDIITVKPR
jgi:hypothetical protein